MTFPNYPDKYNCEPFLTAEDIVAYRGRLGRMPKITPDGALFCLERGLPRRMRWRIPVRAAGHMNADLFQVRKANVTVLTSFGGGSPIVMELAEELAVMGAKRMLLMTWGGTLDPALKPGDIVVIDRAIRDEGASHHYLPSEKYVDADQSLVERLAAAIRARGSVCTFGTTWTTDAPYRETREEIRQYQAEGVKTVEMETAGFFVAGQVRHVPVAAAVVVMDSLANEHWQVPERLDDIQHALEVVYAAAIDVLGRD
jgi:uridine phosphorylase